MQKDAKHARVAEKLWSWIFCFCCLPKVRQHKKLQDHAFPLLSSPSSITRRQKSFWILCWALPLILEPGWARMNYAEPVWARMNYAEPGASELGAATQSLILQPGAGVWSLGPDSFFINLVQDFPFDWEVIYAKSFWPRQKTVSSKYSKHKC